MAIHTLYQLRYVVIDDIEDQIVAVNKYMNYQIEAPILRKKNDYSMKLFEPELNYEYITIYQDIETYIQIVINIGVVL